MKHTALRIGFTALVIAVAPLLHAQQASPVLQGTNPEVSKINTSKLLAIMNHGSPDLVLIAAHRGYWVNFPENSLVALDQAFEAGIETIEIDLRTTSDGQLVISHDPDIVKETTGSGQISNMTLSQLQALTLRDRHGNPITNNLNPNMLSFADALKLLQVYSFGGFGPVIIADLKDPTPWPAYLEGVQEVASLVPDSSTRPAVIFKMKMRNIPSINQLQAEASSHPDYGHILPVVNPEDATGAWGPTTSNFQTLKSLWQNSPNFVQQFELNINSAGDGASQYATVLSSFATYWEARFYPEGVSTITVPKDSNGDPTGPPFTNCCYLPNPISKDMRGVLPFAQFYSGSSLITTDNLAEALNFLVAKGQRNVSELQ